MKQGTTPQLQSTTEDHKFTILPITSTTGQPVMCSVIFNRKKENIPFNYAAGIVATIKPNLDLNRKIRVDASNFSISKKYFPCSPACLYNGKAIKCQTFMPKHKGMTSTILVSTLKILDDLEVFS